MKTILVATDFSHSARNASFFAYEFAQVLKAKIILFNAFTSPHAAPALGFNISRYDIMMQTDKRLMDEADFLDPKKAVMDILLDEGPADSTIINIANEKNIDFIVVGMTGKGRKLFGSIDIALALKSNIHVIIVPENAMYKDLKTIVFAKDEWQPSNLQIPPIIIEIINTFKSKLFVTTVTTNDYNWSETFGTSLVRKQGDENSNVSCENHVSTNVTSGLNEVIKLHNADMIIMQAHHHSWFEKMHRKSEIKDMVFHAGIPVLIIPEEVVKNKNKELMETLQENV